MKEKALICFEQAYHLDPYGMFKDFSHFLKEYFPSCLLRFVKNVLSQETVSQEALYYVKQFYETHSHFQKAHDVMMRMYQAYSYDGEIILECVRSFQKLGNIQDAFDFLNSIYEKEFYGQETYPSHLIDVAVAYRMLGNSVRSDAILKTLQKKYNEDLLYYENMETPENQLEWLEIEESMKYFMEKLERVNSELNR